MKEADTDLLREMVKAMAETLMSAEACCRQADSVCKAPYGKSSPDRVNQRNGYHSRRWYTRTGTVDLGIPKLRKGSYFPAWLLEPRRRGERSLMQRDEEFVKRAAFALIACLAWHDKEAFDKEFIDLIPLIAEGAADERNLVKKGVSWALRNIGKCNPNLNEVAMKAAKEMQRMDSKSARWIASDALRDLTSEATKRRLQKIRD